MSEMVAFCELLTQRERQAGRLGEDMEYRLPTEAEWECAARAGSSTRWSCGDDPAVLSHYAWFDRIGQDHPAPVAQLWPNAWGFYDMEGNVFERCGEHQHTYPGGTIHVPWILRLPESNSWTEFYAARGGSYNMGAVACEPTMRRSFPIESRVSHVGFRLACGRVFPVVTDARKFDNGSPPQILNHEYIHAKPSYQAIMKAQSMKAQTPAEKN
jgi:formylglycine-generating enzyme required for sulfatase activity